MLSKFPRRMKSILRKCDLFAVSQFIRYKGEADYSTATGGFCSITILIIFAVLFTSMAVKTVDREIINWTSETTNEMEPKPTTISVAPAPFLFTVGIMYLDLNNPNLRYFDFNLRQHIWNGPVPVSSRNISLVPCTQQHFSISQNLNTSFHSVPANQWLCPPLGEKFLLSGKFTSRQMSFLEVSVSKCDPLLDPSRPCANATMMQQLQAQIGQFIMTQFFINPLLNPGSHNYLDYYLEDRNYIAFTSGLGTYSNVHVQDYTIITDQSILPFVVPKEESGVIIPELFQNINFEVTSDLYAQLYFYKSSTSVTYNRSYYKVDEFFSYVGGLVGVIMGGMMLLSAYNQDSFEFSLAKDLLAKSEEEVVSNYNFGYYIMLFFHSLFKKLFSSCRNWDSLRKFEEVKEEMGKQLDISFIITRLLFLERSVQVMFERGQFEAMHLNQRLTIQQMKTLRRYYRMRAHFKPFRQKNFHPVMLSDISEAPLQKTNGHSIGDSAVNEEGEEESSSEQQDSKQQAKKVFKQCFEEFPESVLSGNKTSLKISKGMKWRQAQGEFQKIAIQQMPQPKIDINQSQQNEKHESAIELLKIKSSKHKLKRHLEDSNFEFITLE